MNLLLTGCSGYIGSQLVEPLIRRGCRVRGVDRKPGVHMPGFEFVQGDLLDPEVLDRSLVGIDEVWHLAAAKDDWGLSREEYFRDNLEATQALVEAARVRNVRRVVFYSTVAVMGPTEIPLDETAPFAPTIPYGESKALAERLFHEWAASDPDLQVLIIRPSVVFGAGNPSSTNVYRLIEAILKNRFVMIGDGEVYKTTSYVENLIAANLFLIGHMSPGVQTYIYVDDPVYTTRQLVSEIYRLLRKKQAPWSIPLGLARPLTSITDFAGSLLRIDFPITAARIEKFCTGTHFSSAAIRTLGFQQPVSMIAAVERTVAWHVGSNGRVPLPKAPVNGTRIVERREVLQD